MLPRFTTEHVRLNSYSCMRVNLAAQVLSETVSKVMQHYGGDDAAETAKFCIFMDRFFDCTNVRSMTEGWRSLKPFRMPYTSVNDERFHWLETEFLGFFHT